jgi:endonuclease/exonuclease/phosphatase family metal-dependent hydrolase
MSVPTVPVQKAKTTRKRRRGSRVAAALCWFCLIATGAFICYLRTNGDRAWLPTILIFSPRWIFAMPAALLLPLCLYKSCRLPFVLLVLTALFPLMGFCVGWHRLQPTPQLGSQSIRVVTFNLHEIPFDGPAFQNFMNGTNADVLAFEEMPYHLNRSQFPPGLTHIVRHYQLYVASRYPIRDARVISSPDAVRYTLITPAGPVDLIGVHLSSPHFALRDSIDGSAWGPQELARNIENRRVEASLLRSEIDLVKDRPLIIAGDFNLAPDSPLFTENFSDMSDAWETNGFGFGWTYFHQHTMVRIDHVLTNEFLWCKSCAVGPNVGSPHRPVIADLVLRNP